ncbi:MAG TPA: porin family protein, partial [Candidatus Krumholzibacteriaceae bacterium]
PVDLTVKLTYFEIPVLARLNIPTGGAVCPNVYAGPAIGFKMSAKGEAESGSLSAENDIEGLKRTDFGIIVGGGLEFKLTSIRLLFDARYEAGLTSIDDTADAIDVKNGAISFMVGFGFTF